MSKASARRTESPWFLASPALFLFVGLLIVPMAITALLSFGTFDSTRGIQPGISLGNYIEIFSDGYYLELFGRTAGMSLLVTVICILVGVPETLILARMRPAWRGVFFVVLLGPLLISVVVRTLGWSILLGRQGPINGLLLGTGIADRPVQLLFSTTGVVIALTHVLLPLMIIAVWSALQRLNAQVADAARSLGAGPLTTFARVVLPQLLPGILSGAIIVFSLAASSFATPAIIGGRRVKVVTTAIYDEFLSSLNWPLGAALAVLLLIGIVLVVVGANRLVERRFKQVFA